MFAGVLRYAALGLMAAASAALFAKRQKLVREGKIHEISIVTLLAEVDLPIAARLRQARLATWS